ncbi:Zinc protease-like protein [hydrothermal vent metagenome]|uniref:Zinc protease-like protein n=1 Tax=hydrothermal vent metagenome TaxID=652676 RepID=A0A1W1BJ34_9ZZZZ
MSEDVKMIEVNGTKVPMVFEESSFLPLVSMQIVFRNSGAISDTKSGLAVLSAKLLSEGTKADGSIGFATKLENHAIHLSASARNETFTITLSSLKSEFDNAISLLKSLLKDPNYTQEATDRIKKKHIGWLTQQESNFDYIASLGLKETLFAGTPLGRARAGSKSSIESITLDDIQSFISAHLGVNNAIVVIGGDISLQDAQRYTKEVMGLLPTVADKKLSYIEATDKKITKVAEKETQQAYIYFGAPFDLKYSDPKQYISKVANYILGGSGFGSRLMEEIRVKRGLAYSAYSRFVNNRSTSYLSGYLQTKLENEREAKELVIEIIEEFTKNGVTQKELDTAKEFLIGSEPLRNESLSQRLDRAYNDYYYDRPLGYHKEQLKMIESLTLDEINSFIKSHKEIANLSFSIVTAKK